MFPTVAAFAGLLLLFPRAAWAIDYKEGNERSLPPLQTHTRPALAEDHLYWGIVYREFLRYAEEQQWQMVEPPQSLGQSTVLTYQPGGGGIYTPENQLVFIQDVEIRVYFRLNRLIGLLVQPTNRPLEAPTLTQWVRSWFPDDPVRLRYQLTPYSDGVLQAILGDIPQEFQSNLQKLLVPFRFLEVNPNRE